MTDITPPEIEQKCQCYHSMEESCDDNGCDCPIHNVCPDCEGTGIIVEGQHDNIRERKCHCRIQDDMDDDS